MFFFAVCSEPFSSFPCNMQLMMLPRSPVLEYRLLMVHKVSLLIRVSQFTSLRPQRICVPVVKGFFFWILSVTPNQSSLLFQRLIDHISFFAPLSKCIPWLTIVVGTDFCASFDFNLQNCYTQRGIVVVKVFLQQWSFLSPISRARVALPSPYIDDSKHRLIQDVYISNIRLDKSPRIQNLCCYAPPVCQFATSFSALAKVD